MQKIVQLVKFHISIVDFSAGLICMLNVSHDMQVVIRQVQIKQVLIKSNIICYSLKFTLKSLLCDGNYKILKIILI